MTTFLVATDGSETADRAVNEALREAETHSARLIAIHVLDTGSFTSPKRGPWQRFYDELRSRGEDVLDGVRSRAEERGIPCETVLLEGRADREITHFASENDVDLVFVGTVGRSGIRETFLGSTAERVIRRTDRPVTVVPAAYE